MHGHDLGLSVAENYGRTPLALIDSHGTWLHWMAAAQR